jgi:hypothetical protein
MNAKHIQELVGDEHSDSKTYRAAIKELDKIFNRSLTWEEAKGLAQILSYYTIDFTSGFTLGSVELDTELGGVGIGIITMCLVDKPHLNFESWRWVVLDPPHDDAIQGRLILQLLRNRRVRGIRH